MANDIEAVFSELLKNFKDLNRRVIKFETWEPVGGTNIGAHAYLTANFNTTAGAWTTIPYDAELWDTTSIHAAGVFTAPVDGRYLFNTSVPFTAFVGTISLRYLPSVSANYVMQDNFDATASLSPATLTGVFNLSEGDTVQFQVYRAGAAAVLFGSATYPYYSFTQVELLSAT